jgi:hypothetical protein
MDKTVKMLLAGGIVISVGLFLIDIYLGGIALIITVALVMSQLIMNDTAFHPDIAAKLKDDAKAIILTNTGNSEALNIHAALVPLDLEYDLESLAVDGSHEFPLPKMIEEVKVVVTFENEKRNTFSSTFKLSSMGEYDPLKPMVPIFGWKK